MPQQECCPWRTVDTVFWTRVKEGDFDEEKVADLKETKRCTVLDRPMESVRWTRRICREDADLSVLVFGRWIVVDEVKEGGEDPDSTKILMIQL